MTQNKMVRALALACVFAGGPAALAQSTTQGAIAGTIFDAADAVVPNATVVIHNDGTNAELKLTAGSAGEYKAPQLAPGTYTVTISASGFAEQKTTNVVVAVNQVTEISPHLKTGDASEVVQVTADAPVLKFDSPAYGGQLSNTEIENIPINNRRWSSLSLLTPGVTNDASGFGLISFRAISATLNNVLIDGADDNQAYYGEERGRTRAGYSTSQIAVREFQVNTGVYSAEFGRAVGGVVNSVTKSGTNSLHGELYFYHRDDGWSAANPYTTRVAYDPNTGVATTQPFKPKDKRNQFGFGLGGPLIKDKLFFFYAFDEFRRNFPGTARAGNTTFYADPTTADQTTLATRLTSNGRATTQAQALGIYRGFIQALNGNLGPVLRYGNQVINTPKLDYQINGKHHVSALFHRLRWDSPGGVQTQQTNNYAVDSFGTDFVKLDYGLAKLDSIIGNNLTNELRYQYARELNYEGLQPFSSFTSTYLTPSSGTPVQVNLPSTAFTLGAPYYGFRNALPDERKWQVGDTASLLFGKHNLKAGIDLLHNYDILNTLGGSAYPPNGLYTYGTLLGFISDLASPNRGGCGTAAAPVGCYTNYRQTLGRPNFDITTIDYGFFVQDDYKLNPRLTLNLGARYDYEHLPGVILPNTSFAPAQNTPSDKNNISPRIGFAWDPYGQGKMVVRGGYGMYYGHIPNALLLTTRITSGSAAGQNQYSITPSAAAPRIPGTSFSAATAGAPDIQYLASNLANPYTQQFDLAVQQDLGLGNVLSLSYLGSLGRQLPNSLNLNLNPANTYTVNYTVAGSGNCGPLACGSVIPVKVYAGKTVSGSSALLNTSVNAAYAAISNVNTSFHAVTVEMQRRGGKRISYDVNYTWSQALDFNQSQLTGLGSNNYIDPYANQRLNYGKSFLNVPHRVVGWAILNVPGYGGNQVLKLLTSGWSVKPAFQAQSGLPYSANTNSFTAPSQCATATCFVPFTTGLGGTGTGYIPSLRNAFKYPRDIVIDLRVQRDIVLSERIRLELVAESFNVANHQNITGLNTTAYNVTSTANNPNSGVLTYQPTFGVVQNSNNNYAYGPRTLQAGARLFF